MPFKKLRKMNNCKDYSNKRANTYINKNISDFLLNKEIASSSLDYIEEEESSLSNDKDFLRINSYVILFTEKSETSSDISVFINYLDKN